MLLLPALLLGQSRPSDRPITDEIKFIVFFTRLATREVAAKAQGGESMTKRALKDTVGLTDTEFSLVLEVALSCNDAYNAKTRSGMVEVQGLRSQYPQGAVMPAAVAARIDQLERERTKVVSDCIGSLRRGMGAAHYANLENYVRDQGAAIRYIDPAKPDPNPKIPSPPGLIPSGRDPRRGK